MIHGGWGNGYSTGSWFDLLCFGAGEYKGIVFQTRFLNDLRTLSIGNFWSILVEAYHFVDTHAHTGKS